jgi:hypothetical protein
MSGSDPRQAAVERGEERLQDARRSFGDDHRQALAAMLDLAEAFGFKVD